MDWSSKQLAWLSLAMVPGIGPKTLQKILKQQVAPTSCYEMDLAGLKGLGLSEPVAKHILQYPPHKPCSSVELALRWSEKEGQHLLTLECESYPEKLRHIASPPPFLMVKGQIKSLNLPQVAIVGSRYPTSSGAQQAYDFALQLSSHGLIITSGLAKGVDMLAHQGVIDGHGATVAVLGTGVDQIYPKSHSKLAQNICEKGALVSEFPLGTPAMRGHFPRRNRIVSGMSLGTLVIEATLKSGSLITARQALEQNREVMAIPGAIHNPQKAGCHYLIRQGAKLIETPEQVVEEIACQFERDTPIKSVDLSDQKENGAQSNLGGEQLKVFNALDYDGLDMETLVNKTQLEVGLLSMVLMELELSGLLRQEQGLYAKC